MLIKRFEVGKFALTCLTLLMAIRSASSLEIRPTNNFPSSKTSAFLDSKFPLFTVRDVKIRFRHSMIVKAIIAHAISPDIQILSISPSGKRFLIVENRVYDKNKGNTECDLFVYDRESHIQNRIHMPRYGFMRIFWSPSELCILNSHELIDFKRNMVFQLGESNGFIHWSRMTDQVVYLKQVGENGVQFMAANTRDIGLHAESISLQQAASLLGEAFPKADEVMRKISGKSYYLFESSTINISPDGKRFLLEDGHRPNDNSGNVRLDIYTSYLVNSQRVLIKQEKNAMEFLLGECWLDAHRWIFGYEPMDEEFGFGGYNEDDRRCGLWDTLRNRILWRKIPKHETDDFLHIIPFANR